MKKIYNVLKLSEHRELFLGKRVLVIGSGAVGSYLMEYLAKMGVSPDVMDFDRFTLENAAKHSCLVRTPEDVGRNKAECTADRVQVLLDEGCSANGIDADLCKLGPEAFSDYTAVFAAVDNFAAKVLLNKLIRQLPKDRRPVLIMDGTYDEMAQSVIIDNTEFCLECLMDESWMKDADIRTSCTGPQIRVVDGEAEVVRTSNQASSMAAHLSAEQFRGYVLGFEGMMNRRLTYTPFPCLELSVAHPMQRRNCPGCAVKPPAYLESLPGTVLRKTLGEALAEIGRILGSDDFEVSVHRLEYRKVVHAGFVVSNPCRCCGRQLKVMKHEGRMFMNDLLCGECLSANKRINGDLTAETGKILYAFNDNCPEDIKAMTLYELGFPLGAHIEVIQRNNALDFLDENKIKKTTFYCADDHEQMHIIDKL